ncbi:beta-lactamase family protein (plasmid) [Deinococcus sp. KNUC1210]|uniref:serine hydrolase domain-containing protein n=1 Tax=Deinococcus sp. KNUC1210 TaxID=2917691 RepID=UPI001EF118DE|nr:serine hydrolase [Deinococcus sp. KNUC1210]ULH13983.1 beta-lactamase family protein [Deinococcus sp. KNUC1210]
MLAWLDALAADHLELHSFQLLRFGYVVAEGWWAPHSPDRVHRLHSLSKSFTATAIGLLVSEGRLTVEDRLVSFFPNALPSRLDHHLAAMRVHDLLTMRTGHAEDVTGALVTAADGDWIRAFLAQPVQHPPGTHFVYNSAATFMLSALVQHLTGEPLLEFLRPRLFEPLGITRADWVSNPQGINVGAWGLQLTTEAITRFGQLYLQQGRWGSQQLLTEPWIHAATQPQVPPGDETASDWAQGYGFQFWRCRHDAYRADGAFGQFCVVMPEQQAVLVMTANVQKTQQVLDHVWTYLLAGMNSTRPLPRDVTGEERLRARCAALQLALPELNQAWDGEDRQETYTFLPNDEQLVGAQFRTDATSCRLTMTDDRGEHPIDFGLTAWQEGRTFLWGGEEVILTRAGWQPDGTLALVILLIEGGFRWIGSIDQQAGTLTIQGPPTSSSEGATVMARRTERAVKSGHT